MKSRLYSCATFNITFRSPSSFSFVRLRLNKDTPLFSLNLTNEKEDGLRKVMLKVAQLYNLDFKVGISGNLDQAMT
ncbi:hypothetical protein IDZ80_09570, partial [Francisella tularensis subsp. holarctica]|nr:hypothetical protein [Francisella tularensis subsp. holarctica]